MWFALPSLIVSALPCLNLPYSYLDTPYLTWLTCFALPSLTFSALPYLHFPYLVYHMSCYLLCLALPYLALIYFNLSSRALPCLSLLSLPCLSYSALPCFILFFCCFRERKAWCEWKRMGNWCWLWKRRNWTVVEWVRSCSGLAFLRLCGLLVCTVRAFHCTHPL